MAFLLLGLGFLGIGTAFVVESTKKHPENKILHFSYGSSLYTEEKRRNMMFEKYPPCYNICGATRTIQDLFEKSLGSNFMDYRKLLDIFSIVLCQEVHIESKRKDEMLNQRIDDLTRMNGKMVNKVKAKTENMSIFLTLAKNLIDRQVKMMLEDNRINKNIKKDITKLVSVFYTIHYGKLEQY